MLTTRDAKRDAKLVPPQVLSQLLADLDQNREFDMGGYSVPTDTVFAQLEESADAGGR